MIGEALGQPIIFGRPETFDCDDAVTARWTSSDGTFTVDLASIKEATLVHYGAQQVLVDAYLTSIPGSRVTTVGDIGATGSSRAGHARALSCLGDLAVRCDVYGPVDIAAVDLEGTAEAIIVTALRLDP